MGSSENHQAGASPGHAFPVGAVRERPANAPSSDTGDVPYQRRKNVRLPHYDYAGNGAYFVTLVTQNRSLLFADPIMHTAVARSWLWLEDQYEYVKLDAFVVMPNHVHGVLIIDAPPAGRSRTAPTKVKRLGSLIGAFKTVSSQAIRSCGVPQSTRIWQRGFHEHVIRTDQDLERVREYIVENPRNWNEDPENPGVMASPAGDMESWLEEDRR